MGNGQLVFNGYKVSTWEEAKVLELDDGDGCTTMGMYLMPLNRTLKNGPFFVEYILPL